jgi:hypothetical protein
MSRPVQARIAKVLVAEAVAVRVVLVLPNS